MQPRSCETSRARCVATSLGLPPLYLLLPLPSSRVFGAKLKPVLVRAPILRVLGFCSAARGIFASFPPSTPHFHFFPRTAPGIRCPRRWVLRASGWHEIFLPLQVCGTLMH